MKQVRAVALPVVGILGVVLGIVLAAAVAGALTNGWAVIGLLSGLAAALLIYRIARSWVPRRTVLEIDFDRGIVEQTPSSPLARAQAGNAYTLLDLLDALEQAAADKRVVGIVARVGSKAPGVARAQEVADAIREFNRSGKPTIAHVETFGELSSGSLPAILIGASFGKLYLQPGGEFGMTGMVQRKTYLRRLLDKLDIIPELDHRHEFKAAKYLLTEDHMVAPDREATSRYVGAQFEQLLVGIAEGRGLPAGTVRALVDRAPLLAGEARDAGLVDDVLYRDQVLEAARETWANGARTLDIGTYLKRAKRPHRRGPTIALIYGTGMVVQGTSQFDPLTRQPAMGSDDMATAFRAAIEDKKVKAIVFRIDSPGGSAVASDTIWRETRRAIEAGKPVIATMGNVAGSGGYFVAAGCTRIVAQPGTLTGSIGVVAGKLVTAAAWAKAGITFDDVARGENARFMSSDRSFTASETERFQALLDAIYEDFVQKVAEGRGKSFDTTEPIARGRVWVGADARENGLVDELGGIRRAINLAREAAGLDPDKPYKITVVPRPRSLVAALIGRESRDDDKVVIRELLAATAPLAEAAGHLRAAGGSGVLSMDGVTTEL
ncbi:MAG: signal peptide peptidase SppA [Acidimicrobiia bacterium]|nr:signal peptide peptidase SppA [Acidimicrobiia bacterium]